MLCSIATFDIMIPEIDFSQLAPRQLPFNGNLKKCFIQHVILGVVIILHNIFTLIRMFMRGKIWPLNIQSLNAIVIMPSYIGLEVEAAMQSFVTRP